MKNRLKLRGTLAALILIGTYGCTAETAGESIAFSVGLQGAHSSGDSLTSFTTTSGWLVELSEARAALGPVYFYEGEPRASLFKGFFMKEAHACATHAQFNYGETLGELVAQYSVDLLSSTPTDAGQIPGIAGTCQTLEVHLHPAETIPAGLGSDSFDSLGGHTFLFKGSATKDSESRQFIFNITIPDESTMRIVDSVAADVEIKDVSKQPGSAVVQIYLDNFFANVDFSSLSETDEDGAYLLDDESQAWAALLYSLRSRQSFGLIWRP
ncbi:hypothetical protein KAI87_08970 [Myxococcota bacterium]|nr:hypothetical protein [Myxococcota bacterium]